MSPRLPPLDQVLDLLPDAVCIVDTEGCYLFVSAGFERILGYAAHEVVGRRAFELVHPDDRAATMKQASLVTAGTAQRHFHNRYVHKSGHSVDIQWSAHWLADYGVRIGVGREVTELRLAERELEHLASHDALTGLPNRPHLRRELERELARAAETGTGLAVLYLDLDGFKAANDRGGHDAGDHLLRAVAERLPHGLRAGDFVARVGGDEFVALLPGCADAESAQAMAEKVRAFLRPAFELEDGPINIDASFGIACFPDDGVTADALLTHADRAMYAAKRSRSRR